MNMKTLIVSFGDYDYDGRLRELVSCFEKMGETDILCRASISKEKIKYRIQENSYISFLLKLRKYIKQIDNRTNYDAILLDNRKSIIPGRRIIKLLKPNVAILDCREFYTFSSSKTIASKFGCIIEKKAIKTSDIVICANEERAKLMGKMYGLKNSPIVFQNLRQLSFGSDYNEEELRKKFPFVNDNAVKIISTSGCSVFRTDDVLVKNIHRVNGNCILLLAGDPTEKDKKIITKIIKDNNLKNVFILGRLNQTEMKYLFSVCHVGIVNYPKTNLNNLYCASGKLFEYCFEGLPVVTTTNPPLKRMCDQFGIGAYDDCFADGINEVIENYERYKRNVLSFCQINTVENNNLTFIKDLTDAINKIKEEKMIS